MVCVKMIMPIMRKLLAILSVHSHWYCDLECPAREYEAWAKCIVSTEIKYSLSNRYNLEIFASCVSLTSSFKRVPCITYKEN